MSRWPRACASRSRAKVESPAMRMRAIGSICTATVRGMGIHSDAMAAAGSVDFQPIRGRGMAGKAPGRDEDGVAPEGQSGRPGVSREPDPGGPRDAPPFGRADRGGGVVEVGARLHLDERDRAASSGDEIDLPAGYRIAPRDDGIALETQKQDGDRFGLEPEEMRAAPPFCRLERAPCAH